MRSKTFLDTHFFVVEEESSGNAAGVAEHPLLSLQKALSVLVQTDYDKDVAAVTEPAAENLDHLPG